MEEEKGAVNMEKYERVIPRIGYYMKSKNIARIFKEKCPIFAAGVEEKVINLFSNSLEHMGYFSGHKEMIWCLCAISNKISSKILASGSEDTTIKIWNIEDRSIMSTLSGHTKRVSALCYVKEGVFVSGSEDGSLIIWSKSTPESSTYSHRQVLTGHKSRIEGIIRLNNREIVSGEIGGDLMMWNTDQGLCIRQIPRLKRYDNLTQMKQHMRGDVVVNYEDKVRVWRAANNWEGDPIKQFDVREGESIGFLSGNLLLRGGWEGQLEFIDYAQTGCKLPPIIEGLHSDCINVIQRIAKNIVVTASYDGYLKVIHPISRRCYLKFKARKSLMKLKARIVVMKLKARKSLYALAYFY